MGTKAQDIAKMTKKQIKKALSKVSGDVDPRQIKKAFERYETRNPNLLAKIEAKNKAFKKAYEGLNSPYSIFQGSVKRIDASIPKLKKGKYISVKCKLGKSKKTLVT